MRTPPSLLPAVLLVLLTWSVQGAEQPPQGPPRHGLFEHIDTDRNNEISKEEWRRWFESHHGKDGVPGEHRDGDGMKLFERIDSNHDGVIDRKEWRAFLILRREHREQREQKAHALSNPPAGTSIPAAGAGTRTSPPSN